MASSSYIKTGLSSAQVHANLQKFGPNEISSKREFTALKIIFSQFTSLLIVILIIAGTVSILLKEYIDGFAILAIVIINAVIGFIQEYKAENAVKALKKMTITEAVVIRDGKEQKVNIKDLVPGDIVILSEGEKIPADMELIEAFSLQVDEAVLTGESAPANKKVGTEKDSLLFKGTIITSGRGTAKITSTGMQTEFGKIVNLVAEQKETRSPLTIQLDGLGKKVGLLTLTLVTILLILGEIRGISFVEMLMTSVALGVSAIPEGMPIIVTLTLALGVQILARKKAIVRKMNSIETLGATTIICSDKTGTLTLNEMTVKIVHTSKGEVAIPGLGYSFEEEVNLSSPEEKRLLEICENCNSSYVDKNIIGDPTEIALKVLVRKANYIKTYKEIDEKVFTSERKMMSTLSQADKGKMIYSKGAFEELIKHCKFIQKGEKIESITKEDIDKFAKIVMSYSEQALRVLAFAYKPLKGKFEEKDLIFVGVAGMIDPPRKTVKASIEIAQMAGIEVKIITGDNAITAKAVGEKIGLNVGKVITGEEIDGMSDAELKKVIKVTSIFARTNPGHKYRIVDLLQKMHEVVAVTGDGVNDAPALKHADVGIAMGIKGTEATKEVADIVLEDDNFTTIVHTIEEGRRIYNNILAFIKYMLSANFTTIMVVGVITIIGFPLPILPLQILWLNIATDSLPALALGRSNAAYNIMKVPPHPKNENIFRKFFGFIIVAIIIQLFANLVVFFYGLSLDVKAGIDTMDHGLASHARTLVFTQTVMFELFFAFVCKEEKTVTIKSLVSNKALIGAVAISFILQLIMIYSPAMQSVFKTVPLNLTEWLLVVVFASTGLAVPKITEIAKKIFRR